MFLRCKLKSDIPEHDKAQVLINVNNIESIGRCDGGGSIIAMICDDEDMTQTIFYVHESRDVIDRALENKGLVIQP